MADPVIDFIESKKAARQANADLNQLASALASSSLPGISPAGVIAGVQVAGVALRAAGLGASLIPSLQNAFSNSKFLEVTIRNMSTTFAVVPYVLSPSRIDVSEVPGLLLPGTSDTLLLTDDEQDAFVVNESYIDIDLLVSGVHVKVTYSLTDAQDPVLWRPKFTIASHDHSFTPDRTLKAVTYADSSAQVSFSIYTLPIDTTSGTIDLTIMDLAPSSVADESR